MQYAHGLAPPGPMTTHGIVSMTAFTSWSARHRPDEPPSRDTAMAGRPPWRIRTSLAVLVVACVLPGLLLSTYFIVSDYEAHKARAIRDVIGTARAAAASLDRDLASIESGLRVLGSSAALADDDLAAFHAQARGALPFQNINNIVLIDPQGHQQVNTLRAWGSALPLVGGPPQLMRIFTTAQPVLTDVFTGPVTDSSTRTIPHRTITEMKLGIYSTSWIFCLIFLLSMRLSRNARMMGMGKPHSRP